MSTFIIHLLIPPLMMLAWRIFPRRYVWAWVWVSIVPDFDYVGWILYVNDVLPFNFHRALFHNVFLLFVLIGLTSFQYGRFRARFPATERETLAAYAGSWAGAGWFLSTYYYFSHLLLDVFQGGVVPFWPISNHNLYSFFLLTVDTQTQTIRTQGDVVVQAGVPEVSAFYPWLDSEQFAYLLLLGLTFLLSYAIRRMDRRVRIVEAVRVHPSLQA